RAGTAAQRVRTRRGRVARDPRARDRPRPRDPGEPARAPRGRHVRQDRKQAKEEGQMSDRYGGRRGRWAWCVLALALAAAAVVVASASAGHAASCGTVSINEQAWAGSTANTYVVKYVLEHNLKCKVNITKITEIPLYQAMADGKVDAVLEDWQHVDQYKQYVTKQHTSVLEGSNGVNGHIGWYIPDYLMKQHPEVA